MEENKNGETTITELIKNSKNPGKLFTSEINTSLEEQDFDAGILENLFEKICSAPEIIDDLANATLDMPEPDSEEVRAYEWIEDGDPPVTHNPVKVYLEAISVFQPLTEKEELDLAMRIGQGDESAMRKLEEANLRHVVSIAKEYADSKVPFLDLIQEGNDALMKAVKKYDQPTGIRFSTYAGWWIRSYIISAIENHCRLLVDYEPVVDTVKKIKKAYTYLLKQNGCAPTVEEIAELLQMHAKRVQEILKLLEESIPQESSHIDTVEEK